MNVGWRLCMCVFIWLAILNFSACPPSPSSSGSMKDHLPLLKETLQFMVQQLRAEDKLCLITFDHEVNHHHTITVATQPRLPETRLYSCHDTVI